jgi:hypothetical protein
LYPFFKLLKSKLKKGDTFLVLGDRTGWLTTLLNGIFPGMQIVSTWEGNRDVLGYKGFHYWFKNEKNITASFCSLNQPLPFADNSFSLVTGFDVLHSFNQPLLIL